RLLSRAIRPFLNRIHNTLVFCFACRLQCMLTVNRKTHHELKISPAVQVSPLRGASSVCRPTQTQSVSDLYPSKWLKADNVPAGHALAGRSVIVTITAVAVEQLHNPRTHKPEPKAI